VLKNEKPTIEFRAGFATGSPKDLPPNYKAWRPNPVPWINASPQQVSFVKFLTPTVIYILAIPT
jgi:hypothetical protein